MHLNNLDQKKLFDAIRDGIADGLFRIATNGSSMPTHDFFDSIEEGVRKGIAGLGVRLAVERDDPSE